MSMTQLVETLHKGSEFELQILNLFT